ATCGPRTPRRVGEIREPVRLLFLVETTPQTLAGILDRHPNIGKLCRNHWMQLAALAPDSSEIQVFHDGQFQPYLRESDRLPQAASSLDWYRGWRDHLCFAEIATGGEVLPLPVASGERCVRD